MELTPEEMAAKLRELEERNQALERSKTGLQADLAKRKSVERLAKAAGIDLGDQELEDKIAQLLASKSASASAAGTTSVPPVPPAPPAPAGSGASGEAGESPSSAVEEALRAQLASVLKKVNDLSDEVKKERAEKEQERTARQEEFKKGLVIQELEKVGCKRPHHLYALQGRHFRLLDDGETVVYGPEESPVNVSDAVANLEKDEEFSIYFPGVVASGSGLPTSRSSMPVTDNPFTKSGGNATRASQIYGSDKGLAQRLVQQARARNDLDQTIASALFGRK